MPLVPIDIPSDTPTVLNWYPTKPALSTPSLTLLLRSSRCILQGFPVYHTDEIPTCASFNLSSFMPVAYSIAWEAPWDFGSVICAEILLSLRSPLCEAEEENPRLFMLARALLILQLEGAYTYFEAVLAVCRVFADILKAIVSFRRQSIATLSLPPFRSPCSTLRLLICEVTTCIVELFRCSRVGMYFGVNHSLPLGSEHFWGRPRIAT